MKSYPYHPLYHIPSPKIKKRVFCGKKDIEGPEASEEHLRSFLEFLAMEFSSGFSVIGSSLGSSVTVFSFLSLVIGFSLGSSVIGCSLGSPVIESSLGFSVIGSLRSSATDSFSGSSVIARFLSWALSPLFPVYRYFFIKKMCHYHFKISLKLIAKNMKKYLYDRNTKYFIENMCHQFSDL